MSDSEVKCGSLRVPAAAAEPRCGPRPHTRLVVPHLQLDQWPSAAVLHALIERGRKIPGVGQRESRMARPGTLALWISECMASGPGTAFLDDHEFCHIHPLPEGSLHLTLPDSIRAQVIGLGWAEPHPFAAARYLPQTVVMVYAPRNDRELAAVLSLIEISMHFACGDLQEA